MVAVYRLMGFPGGSWVRESFCQCRRLKFLILDQKIPREENGPGNHMDGRSWGATAHGIAEESDRDPLTEQQHQQYRLIGGKRETG